MVGVCTFALFAQIVNFDMVSNILNALFCQRFAKSLFNGGSRETRNFPPFSNRHVIDNLEIANNLNLNTYERKFVLVSRPTRITSN